MKKCNIELLAAQSIRQATTQGHKCLPSAFFTIIYYFSAIRAKDDKTVDLPCWANETVGRDACCSDTEKYRR